MPDGRTAIDSDTIRIDEAGVAHPTTAGAQQAMERYRGREMQLIRSPSHVVVLREVAAEPAERRLWMSGELNTPGRILDIAAMVAQAKWRGEIVIDDGGDTRSVFVRDAKVIGASSTAPSERLGEMLRRDGELTDEQLQMAVSEVSDTERFGDAAVRLGFVGRETLFRYLHRQTEEIAYAAMAVADGTFSFYEHVAVPVSFPLAMPLIELMFEAVRRIDEMDLFRERIPSSEHIVARVEGRIVDAREDGYSVYLAVNGERSVEQVAAASGCGLFETTRQLDGLKKNGAVTVRPPGRTGLEGLVHTFNEAMELILSEVDRYGAAGRNLRSSLASFADNGVVYDRLFADAGPDEDGCLDAELVVHNLADLTELGPADQRLGQWLYEYAAFALFIAEPILRAGVDSDATAIASQVTRILTPLTPDF